MRSISSQSDGVAALLVVLVVGAAALILSINAAMLGLGELEDGYAADRARTARAFADGCVDEGMRRFRLDQGYTGGTITIGDSSCILTITDDGVRATTIATAQTRDDFYSVVEAVFVFSGDTIPVLTLETWREIP